jgi:acyl-coenzyme A thioesterase PaaI-like protein
MGLQDAFDRVQRSGANEDLAEVAWRLDYGPSLGFCNPAAAPVRTWQTDRGTRGVVRFGARYEGPPGCVNGGYVAAALDEVLGLSAARSGMQAVTGRLTVSYRKPTPLEKELALTGHLVRVDGRKITVEAHLRDGDELLAEAEGLFLALRGERG